MKSWKQIQQQLSQEFNLPLKQIQQITDSYWMHIRYLLRNPTEMIYRIEGIGTMRTNQQRLFKLLKYSLMYLYRIRFGVKVSDGKMGEETKLLIRLVWKLKQRLGWRVYGTKLTAKQEVLRKMKLMEDKAKL